MGFSSGIYSYPKIGVPLETIFDAELYYNYSLYGKYTSVEEFVQKQSSDFPLEDIKALAQYVHTDDTGRKIIEETHCVLYSSGIDFHHWMTEHINRDDWNCLSKDELKQMMQHAWEMYSSFFGTEYVIERGYSYDRNGDDEYPPIISRPIDGIEAMDENGKIVRIDCDPKYGGSVFLSENGQLPDANDVNTYKTIFESLMHILINIDLDKNVIRYEGSY